MEKSEKDCSWMFTKKLPFSFARTKRNNFKISKKNVQSQKNVLEF